MLTHALSVQHFPTHEHLHAQNHEASDHTAFLQLYPGLEADGNI